MASSRDCDGVAWENRLNYGSTSVFNALKSVTLCFWVNFDSVSSTQKLLDGPFDVGLDSSGELRIDVGTSAETSGLSLSTGTWYMISFSWHTTSSDTTTNMVETEIRVDAGAPESMASVYLGTSNRSTIGSTSTFTVSGIDSIGASPLNGRLAHVRVFATSDFEDVTHAALTQEELEEIMRNPDAFNHLPSFQFGINEWDSNTCGEDISPNAFSPTYRALSSTESSDGPPVHFPQMQTTEVK